MKGKNVYIVEKNKHTKWKENKKKCPSRSEIAERLSAKKAVAIAEKASWRGRCHKSTSARPQHTPSHERQRKREKFGLALFSFVRSLVSALCASVLEWVSHPPHKGLLALEEGFEEGEEEAPTAVLLECINRTFFFLLTRWPPSLCACVAWVLLFAFLFKFSFVFYRTVGEAKRLLIITKKATGNRLNLQRWLHPLLQVVLMVWRFLVL